MQATASSGPSNYLILLLVTASPDAVQQTCKVMCKGHELVEQGE